MSTMLAAVLHDFNDLRLEQVPRSHFLLCRHSRRGDFGRSGLVISRGACRTT